MLLASITACTERFDIDLPGLESRTVLYSMPAGGCDTTVIQLSHTVPVTSGGTPPRGIEGAGMEFLVNGTPCPVCWTERPLGSVPAMSYYAVGRLDAGDRIEIRASADGLDAVGGSSEVPAAPSLKGVELARANTDEGEVRQFRITFADDAARTDYYGLRVLCRESVSDASGGVAAVSVKSEKLDVSAEPLLNNKVGLDATFDFDYDYYQDLCIWPDGSIAGREYTLRVNAPLRLDSSEASYSYMICLYSLSAELYEFLKSLNDIANNELGQNGLAPVRSHYSNISGGFGIVGACSVVESAWLSDNCAVSPE